MPLFNQSTKTQNTVAETKTLDINNKNIITQLIRLHFFFYKKLTGLLMRLKGKILKYCLSKLHLFTGM